MIPPRSGGGCGTVMSWRTVTSCDVRIRHNRIRQAPFGGRDPDLVIDVKQSAGQGQEPGRDGLSPLAVRLSVCGPKPSVTAWPPWSMTRRGTGSPRWVRRAGSRQPVLRVRHPLAAQDRRHRPSLPVAFLDARPEPGRSRAPSGAGRGGDYLSAAVRAGERSSDPASAIVPGRIGDGLNPFTMR
jgi:hypothetical protein